MTDAEISRRLALAIGYTPEDVVVEGHELQQLTSCKVRQTSRFGTVTWFRPFNYSDPTVIWPIAERFDCFPQKRFDATGWTAVTADAWLAGENFCVADTAAKAVALAVIKAHEKSKT